MKRCYYHKTKRDLNDEHTSNKSLLSFTGQNPLKILLNPLKLASQIGVEPTTFRLGELQPIVTLCQSEVR